MTPESLVERVTMVKAIPTAKAISFREMLFAPQNFAAMVLFFIPILFGLCQEGILIGLLIQLLMMAMEGRE